MDGPGQDGIKPLPLNSDGKDDLLPRLGAPPRAVHQPQEARLDATHAAALELAAEVPMPRGEVADGGLVCLVDDDRSIVKLRQNMTTALGPPNTLVDITRCTQTEEL